MLLILFALICTVSAIDKCLEGEKLYGADREDSTLILSCQNLQRASCVEDCIWASTCRETPGWNQYRGGKRSYVAGVRENRDGLAVYCCVSMAVTTDRCGFTDIRTVQDQQEMLSLQAFQVGTDLNSQADALIRDVISQPSPEDNIVKYRVEVCSIKRERPHCNLRLLRGMQKERYRILLLRRGRSKLFSNGNSGEDKELEQLKFDLFTTTGMPTPPPFIPSTAESNSIDSNEKDSKESLKGSPESDRERKRRPERRKPPGKPKNSHSEDSKAPNHIESNEKDSKPSSGSAENGSKEKRAPERRTKKPDSEDSKAASDVRSVNRKPKENKKKKKPRRSNKARNEAKRNDASEKSTTDKPKRKNRRRKKKPTSKKSSEKTSTVATTAITQLTEQCPKPDWSECITLEEANYRFNYCCALTVESCATAGVCRFDANPQQVTGAVISGRCPLSKVAQVLKCASQDNDATQCCQEKGVLDGGRAFCAPFCHPTAHSLNLNDMRNMPCVQQAGKIAECFRAYFNPMS